MNELKQTVGFLQNVPLFHNLNNRQLEHLAKRMVERTYDSQHPIVAQGKGGEGFFVIISGKAEAFRERSDGEKVVVNTFGPTDFFGELALLDDGLRTASVVAVEPTKCLVLTRWDFLAALRESDVEMSIVILQELAKRFRRALDAL
ncbi:MAG TPA: cyclic nucleotide-binding domain-containing protein [Anaerolineales bacterium]|nr:cyclic nucleotide-binding domain-containing protein [Anaerolineales bacterium]